LRLNTRVEATLELIPLTPERERMKMLVKTENWSRFRERKRL